MISARLFFLVVLFFACFASVAEAQWGYGYRPYGYGPRPYYGGYRPYGYRPYGYRPYGGYYGGWGK